MFVLRGLFWLAVVALLMPRGPDLGLDISSVRADLAQRPAQLTLIDDMRGQFTAIRDAAGDPVQTFRRTYRESLLQRLDAVRAELATGRDPEQDNPLINLRALGFR